MPHRLSYPLLCLLACQAAASPVPVATSLAPRRHAARQAASQTRVPTDQQADHVLVQKKAGTMKLLRGGKTLSSWYVMTGRAAGPKHAAGDLRTPEGTYFVDERKTNSCCFLALHLSYPNDADRAFAAREHVEPGLNIEIHGMPRHPPAFDPAHPPVIGTHGCVELNNADMAEVFKRVPLGTPVTIEP